VNVLKNYFMSEQSIKNLVNNTNQKTAHFDTYMVNNSDSEVYLTIYPGDNRQTAVTDIYLDGNAPTTGVQGSLENYLLGSNENLGGKYLDVYTAITDTSSDSDLTSLDFKLEGGVDPYKFYMEKSVLNEGATVLYKMSIMFLNQ
jgi:hypothetical protein